MSKIIGIDLGTTNSCVACLKGKNVEVISNAEGEKTTPSAVSFKQNNDGTTEIIVGDIAKRNAITNPDTVLSIKRKMGSDERVAIQGKEHSPEEISAMILQKIKRDVEDHMREPVDKAVITVPAYFDDAQRQATKNAGKIAGLEVLRIINEPTAAALAYGLDSSTENEKILVYDLGGGTFDVSILELRDGTFEVLATSGDNFLGGDDFDQVLIDYLITKFKEKTGVSLEKDRMALQRLREAAETAKKALSTIVETKAVAPFISVNKDGPLHLEETITRQQFEEMTSHLLQRTVESIHSALTDAEIDKSQLNDVLLVGGMTRMPAVAALITEQLDKTPNKKINPDEVVAMGAGIQAAVLSGDIKDVLLLDVTPLTLSIETLGGVAFPLIKRNSTIPIKVERVFSTAQDNQTAVDIRVFQGERQIAIDNKLLGEFTLTGISPAPKGLPQIQVGFNVNANGILSVSAKDLKTNKEQSITISNTTTLTEEEIDRMVQDAEVNKESDEKRRQNIQMKIAAQESLSRLNKLLEEDYDFDPDEREEIFRTKRDLTRAIDEENWELIAVKHSALEEIINKINKIVANQNVAGSNESNGAEGGTSEEDMMDEEGEMPEEEDLMDEESEDLMDEESEDLDEE